jgi:hypothetical protein
LLIKPPCAVLDRARYSTRLWAVKWHGVGDEASQTKTPSAMKNSMDAELLNDCGFDTKVPLRYIKQNRMEISAKACLASIGILVAYYLTNPPKRASPSEENINGRQETEQEVEEG